LLFPSKSFLKISIKAMIGTIKKTSETSNIITISCELIKPSSVIIYFEYKSNEKKGTIIYV